MAAIVRLPELPPAMAAVVGEKVVFKLKTATTNVNTPAIKVSLLLSIK